jgi:AAA domain-containing protein/carboxypeptidase family protein
MTNEPLYQSPQTDFYTTRGALPRDAQSYVERQADDDLYKNLIEANFCYVLTARQVGKSSLMLKTAARLQGEGVAVAVLDLTAIGQNVTAEQWYYGLLEQMGRRLGLEDELEDYWLAHDLLGPLNRWTGAITDVVLARYTNKIVIFIDEIDAVRSLPFETGEFFAGIREFFSRRQVDQELSRLTFCLLGAARPSDLVSDLRMAPFNIAKRIDLTDFTEREATPLTSGLSHKGASADKLVKRVLYWTGGHPYLTQCLCHALAEEPSVNEIESVDRLCERLFLSAGAREQDENLQYVSKRIMDEKTDTAGLLSLYSQVHKHRCAHEETSRVVKFLHKTMSVEDDKGSLQEFLEIVGIVRIVQRCLRVRNRVYHKVFDRRWVDEKMPQNELTRQIAAYRKKLLRWSALAGFIFLVITASAVYAFVQNKHAEDARSEAEAQRHEAVVAREEVQATRDQAIKNAEEAALMNYKRDEAEKDAKNNAWQTKLMTWQVIMNDTNPLTFEAYLEVDKETEFTKQARRRLRDLRAAPSNATQLNGVLRGRVYDTGTSANEPIEGAKLVAKRQDVDWSLTMFSNKTGEFMLAPMPPGPYTITVSAEAEGYTEHSVSLQVGPESVNKIKRQSFGLAKKESNPS